MGQLNDFQYYLTRKSDGKYYYIDGSGNLQTQVAAIELPYAPDGWKETKVSWERGFTYHGVFTNYTTPLKFIREGAKILRSLYYTYGIEADCQLYIKKLNRTTLAYADFILGEIDFSTLQDLEFQVIANIMQGGFVSKLKARENTNYPIDVQDNADVVWVNMDGIPLWAYDSYLGIDQPNDNSGSTIYQQNQGFAFPYLTAYNSKGYNNGDIFIKGQEYIDNIDTQFFTQGAVAFISVSMYDKWFLENRSATDSYTVRIKGSMYIGSVNNDSVTRNLEVRILAADIGSGTINSDTTISTGAAILAGATNLETLEWDEILTVSPQERLFFMFSWSGNVSVNTNHIFTLEMDSSFQNSVRQSYVPCVPAKTVFSELIGAIGDGLTPDSSTLLDTTYPDVLLTCGDALRLLAGNQIKTNLMDLFKSMNTVFGTSLMYDTATNTISLEVKDEAYDSGTQTVDLGAVADIQVMPFTEDVFSNLKIGFNTKPYDEFNGKDEYNTTSEYLSPIVRRAATLDMVSPYRADIYGIELTRANLLEKKTADGDSDNDVFFIHADLSAVAGTFDLNGVSTDYYNLYRTPINPVAGASYFEIDNIFLDVDGVYRNQDKAFNIMFTPLRCLERSGSYIRALMYPQASSVLKWQVTSKNNEGNVKLITSEGSPVVVHDESADVQINTLASPLFYPVVFNITARTPFDLLSLVEANPYGYAEFTWLGNTYYGFIIEMTEEIVNHPKQEFKLLATATNTLSNLVH